MGYTFRSTLEKQADGDVLVLQARNILEGAIIKEGDLLRAYLGNNRTNALAKDQDVVLSSRGSFKAAVIQVGAGHVVAASSVYLLRLKSIEVLPEYLAIYLNSDLAQRQIKERVTGVVIGALLRRDLEELEVAVPSLEIQRKIINIYKNNLQYRALLKQKMQVVDVINAGLINKLIR